MGTNRNYTFQSTPPRRWWQVIAVWKSRDKWFQSTPPRRWWLIAYFPSIRVKISIHTTTQVVTCWHILILFLAIFQSTPPRRWWQTGSNKTAAFKSISIHTTTQVVTESASGDLAALAISIHTTTQVVTYLLPGKKSYRFYFNPHHHAGGDRHDRLDQELLQLFQSTPPRRWWPTYMTYGRIQ